MNSNGYARFISVLKDQINRASKLYFMKTLNTLVTGLALAITGCQEIREDTGNPIAASEWHKTIGEEIPYETGMNWISRYRENIVRQGRTESADYQISISQLDSLLGSVGDLTGVAFHYGLDEVGTQHIMAIPISSSLSLWPSNATQVIIDANSGQQISQDQAFSWASNFSVAHPSEIWFHFFGREVFDEMKALPYMDALDLEPALDDSNVPQLLLIIWNDESWAGGRTQYTTARVYDASNACPPCAVR